MTISKDIQIGGDHYRRGRKLQVWDVVADWFNSLPGMQAFLAGNAIKYLARFDAKGGVQDLDKATHYIEQLKEEVLKGQRALQALTPAAIAMPRPRCPSEVAGMTSLEDVAHDIRVAPQADYTQRSTLP